ncbi:hypothetical protein [Haloarcula halophila]|uniref:hypothetical protein n=1 Tax=Haloarcula TaxID=2237 RepID=UPI0023E3A9E0|nr:hypothetical protein [Halomicroarcula sp. DFY41]
MPSLSDPTATDRPAATTRCPLCDHDGDAETDIYVHLQVSHRKSVLSEALIEAVDDQPTAIDP